MGYDHAATWPSTFYIDRLEKSRDSHGSVEGSLQTW
jgi:hypothetical protein